MKINILIVFCLVLSAVIVTAVPIPIEFNVNILNQGQNVDVSKKVTLSYNGEDGAGNPVSKSINTVDDLNPSTGPIWFWDICTTANGCSFNTGKSLIFATFGIYHGGTDIILSVEGYPAYTFSSVSGNVEADINLNSAPVIDWFSPASLILKTRESFSLLFNHTSSDFESDPLTYSWKLDTVEQATTRSWTFATDETQCGKHDIELEVSDGQLTDSQSWTVDVYVRGDVNKDGEVGILDLASIGLAYRSQPGDGNWNKNADIFPGPGVNGELEGDDTINIFDLAMVGLNYGRSCT